MLTYSFLGYLTTVLNTDNTQNPMIINGKQTER